MLVADALTIGGVHCQSTQVIVTVSPAVRCCSRKLVRGEVKKWNQSQQVPVPDSGDVFCWNVKQHQKATGISSDQWAFLKLEVAGKSVSSPLVYPFYMLPITWDDKLGAPL